VTSLEFDRGLNEILRALRVALKEAGVPGAAANYAKSGSAPGDTVFSVNANGRTEFITFNVQEIEDSAGGLDSFAATKVRMIVSRFEGQ
jgi:hypothetical protein